MKIVLRSRTNQSRSEWTDISTTEVTGKEALPPLALELGVASAKAKRTPESIVGVFVEDGAVSLLVAQYKANRDGVQENFLADSGLFPKG